MTMPYVTPSDPQEVVKQRLRAQLLAGQGYGRPSDFLPDQPGPGQYSLAEIGNAAVNRDPTPHPVREAILRGLDGGLRGLAFGNDPDAPGASGFLGAMGQSYSATRDLQDRTQREQIAARIAAQTAQEESVLRLAQANYYNAGAYERGTQGDKNLQPQKVVPPRPVTVTTPEGPAQLGPDGQYHYISPVGTPPPRPAPRPRVGRQVTPPDQVREQQIQKRALELIRGDLNHRPMAAADARRQAEAEIGAINPGASPGGAKPTSADRWEALRATGMSSDSATAQVNREIRAGQVTP